MRALTLLWHHLIGKRTTISGAIWGLLIIIWQGFLKYKEGEDIFIDWFVATLAESWLPFLVGGFILLVFHLCRLDLYLRLETMEESKPKNVNRQSLLIGSLLELVTTYSKVSSNILFESQQSKAISYLEKVKTLPDMVDIRKDIEDFLGLFSRTTEEWSTTVATTYKSKELAEKDLARVQNLAKKLSKELDH